jgi:hypothetical protein
MQTLNKQFTYLVIICSVYLQAMPSDLVNDRANKMYMVVFPAVAVVFVFVVAAAPGDDYCAVAAVVATVVDVVIVAV